MSINTKVMTKQNVYLLKLNLMTIFHTLKHGLPLSIVRYLCFDL